MYICIYTYTYTYWYIYTYVYRCLDDVHVYAYIHIYIYIHTYIYTYIYIYVCIYIYIYIYIYTYIYLWLRRYAEWRLNDDLMTTEWRLEILLCERNMIAYWNMSACCYTYSFWKLNLSTHLVSITNFPSFPTKRRRSLRTTPELETDPCHSQNPLNTARCRNGVLSSFKVHWIRELTDLLQPHLPARNSEGFPMCPK